MIASRSLIPPLFFIPIALFASYDLTGQVQRAKLYNSGDSLFSIRHGTQVKIPQGWRGGVPQDTEVLLLVPNKPADDQLYVNANVGETASEIKARWLEGIDLGYGFILEAKGDIKLEDQVVSAEFTSQNSVSAQRRTFGKTICGPYQICITAFVSGQAKNAPENLNALNSLISSVTFAEPQPEGQKDYVDWEDFFGNKYVYTFETARANKKVNEIWFCEDGSFTSKLKRKGKLASIDNKYLLKKRTGKWSITDKGGTDSLTLNYDDERIPEFSVPVEMVDQKLFINGNRHYRTVLSECPTK